MSTANLDIVITAWGEEYVNAFLRVALPSLLAPGNFPSLAQKARIRLQIFTSNEGHSALSSDSAVHKAGNYALINIHQLGPGAELAKLSPYGLQNSAINQGITEAKDANADIMVLAPDIVVSDGSLLNLFEKLEGKESGIVLLPSVRVNKYPFLVDLMSEYGWEVAHAKSLTLSGRELAALGMRHLHPLIRGAFVSGLEDGTIQCRPPLFFWPIAETGLLIKAMIWSPIFIRPRIWPAGFEPTIDFQDFPAACGIAPDELIPIEDSDDVLMLEFSSLRADFYKVDREHATIDSVIDWIGRMGMPHHLRNLKYTHAFHAGELEKPAIAEIAAFAEQTVEEILERTRTLADFGLVPKLPPGSLDALRPTDRKVPVLPDITATGRLLST